MDIGPSQTVLCLIGSRERFDWGREDRELLKGLPVGLLTFLNRHYTTPTKQFHQLQGDGQEARVGRVRDKDRQCTLRSCTGVSIRDVVPASPRGESRAQWLHVSREERLAVIRLESLPRLTTLRERRERDSWTNWPPPGFCEGLRVR